MAKILIVDDYQEIRHLYSELLEKSGHEVEDVENADLAVSRILDGGFNLILLDLQMPEKNGLWVLEQIKEKTPQKPNGKIVIMCFIDDESTKDLLEKTLKNGAEGFLNKKTPIGEELLKKIDGFLSI